MQKARDPSKKTIEALDPKALLRDRKLMIADLDPVHRTFLLKIMSELGCDTRNIFVAKDSTEALALVKNEGITTVLYDDSLGTRTLESLQEAMAGVPAESVFVFLLSANSSQAGVGRAVESDVDGFALKPFASEEFKADFLQAFVEKIQPDEFRKILNLGKSRLYEGDLDQAEKLFEKAKDLGPSPSSAHFYSGQVKLIRQLLDESRQEFMQGILLNQIHCKCLKSMFELLQKQQKIDESYEVLRRLVGVFPDHIERLQLVIRMAVKTENFFDILTWFEVYEGQGEKPEELQKHVSAALSILGRFLLVMNKAEEAVEAFERSLDIGVKKEVFLTYAVESLQKYGMGEEAARLVTIHDPALAEALASAA